MQTVSAVVVQAVLTPSGPNGGGHGLDVHVVHGALPEAEKVLPATHGTLQMVSAVVVQTVLTPPGHIPGGLQGKHRS